jgi:hypothetical protein
MQAAQADVRSYHERLYWQAEAVDLAAGLRTPALVAQSTGGIKHAEAFDVGYAKLMRYHGLANGLFSGDDLLAGASPSRGTVCAAIGELMTTLETLLAAQGRAIHGDLLERLAYNALPAAYAGNMRLQQRVQQPNQVDIGPANREWYSAEPEANAFDACALDAGGDALHHGFPRFAASLWMAAPDEGLAAVAYAPCTVRARAGGAVVCIDVETGYPFEDVVRLRVHAREPVEFPLRLRVPDWAEGASLRVNGEAANSDCPPGDFAVVRRVWQDGDTVVLTFPMRVALSAWYHGSGALMRGPLLLALAGGGAGAPVRWPEDQAWAYALLPGEGSCVRCDPTQAAPFGHGLPLIVEVKAVPLPDWKLKQGSADAPPIAPVVDRGQAVSLPLIPYGATALRICQFPLA